MLVTVKQIITYRWAANCKAAHTLINILMHTSNEQLAYIVHTYFWLMELTSHQKLAELYISLLNHIIRKENA